jgi:hypothetical protein
MAGAATSFTTSFGLTKSDAAPAPTAPPTANPVTKDLLSIVSSKFNHLICS